VARRGGAGSGWRGTGARLGSQLPAGYEFRRAATHDFPDDQFPPGDVITSPPGTVTISIGRPPWIQNPPPFHPPEKIPSGG